MNRSNNSSSSESFYHRRRSSIANNSYSSPNPNSSSLRNLSQDPYNNTKPQNYSSVRGSSNHFQVDPSLNRRASVQRERIPWGVSSNEDHFQTSYKNLYETQGKGSSIPKTREPFCPSERLSLTLVPLDVYVPRKAQKDGAFNYTRHRKMPSESNTFFDRFGERKESSSREGRLYIPEPKYKEPSLNSECRFYRTNTEPSDGDFPKQMSQSRAVKHMLDFETTQNCIISGNYEKNSQANEAISTSETQIMNKLGPGYSHVTRRVLTTQPKGKRQSSSSPRNDDLKAIIAHSYLKKEQTVTIEMTENEEAPKLKPTIVQSRTVQPNKTKVSFSPQAKQSPNATQSGKGQVELSADKNADSRKLKLNVVKIQDNTPSIETSPFLYENRVKGDERRQSRSTAVNSALSKVTRSGSVTHDVDLSRERSRSNSLQSVKGTSSVRNSSNGVRNTSKDKTVGRESSVNKNSTVVVSHEKKKPISGGSFGNPMLKKTTIQKSINMATMGTLSQNKRVQVGQKRI